MKKQFAFCCLGLCFLISCSSDCKDGACMKTSTIVNETGTIAKNSSEEVSCKLTSEELRKRKETVLTNLKRKILEKKELTNGYSFRFEGTDTVIDELIEFVKSERTCCNFFVFTLSFSGDGKETWLSLTGPDGAKEMISTELGL